MVNDIASGLQAVATALQAAGAGLCWGLPAPSRVTSAITGDALVCTKGQFLVCSLSYHLGYLS